MDIVTQIKQQNKRDLPHELSTKINSVKLYRQTKEELKRPPLTKEGLIFWLHQFRKLDVTKEAHRQMLIDTFVNAVFLYDDKLLLTFNFKDGTRTILYVPYRGQTPAKQAEGAHREGGSLLQSYSG